MNRNSDRPRLVNDRPSDWLPNPPRGIGGELIASSIFKFVDSWISPRFPLNQIQELQAPIRVLLGNTDHSADLLQSIYSWPVSPEVLLSGVQFWYQSRTSCLRLVAGACRYVDGKAAIFRRSFGPLESAFQFRFRISVHNSAHACAPLGFLHFSSQREASFGAICSCSS